MRRVAFALVTITACGPLIPLPPTDRADVATGEDSAPKADAVALDTSVCVYPLRTGCVGPGGCTGYRDCDFTQTFEGPCTCYPDAGWDRPEGADAMAPADTPAPPRDGAAEGGGADAGADVPETTPDAADGATEDRPDVPADVLTPSRCVAHPPPCATNADCAACGASAEGSTFCCLRADRVCYLRAFTHSCMP